MRASERLVSRREQRSSAEYNQAAVRSDLDHQNGVIVDHLRIALQGVIAVYRFGSTAHGTASDTSDTDIGVLSQTRIPAALRFDVQEQLASQIGCDVDLIDLAAASPVMAIQAVALGQLLYDGDSSARGRFEDLTFGAYAGLNEERRSILERIAAEGTVYGR
jgi:predicted nucleotidyltransferase